MVTMVNVAFSAFYHETERELLERGRKGWEAGKLLESGRQRSGRFLGEGNGYPLQYSCLENSIDRLSPWTHKESDMTE